VDRVYNSYPVTSLVSALKDPEGADGFNISNATRLLWAWKILAKSHPEKTEVLAPQYLGEMPEIPQLLRWRGLSLLQRVGKTILLDRWVSQPLLSDLQSMYKFNNLVHNRLMELNKIAEGKSLGKRVSLGQGQKTVTRSISMESVAAPVSANEMSQYSYRAWGTVQWFAPLWSPYRSMPPPQLRNEAINSLLGLSTKGALETLWELIPWSWLIDWMSNVGTMISGFHNALRLTYRGMCLIVHSKSESTFTPLPLTGRYQNTIVSPVTSSWERKKRYANLAPILPVPIFEMPILNARRLSTLGALWAANKKFKT